MRIKIVENIYIYIRDLKLKYIFFVSVYLSPKVATVCQGPVLVAALALIFVYFQEPPFALPGDVTRITNVLLLFFFSSALLFRRSPRRRGTFTITTTTSGRMLIFVLFAIY